MGKQAKATKKFEKRHLKETIDRRKEVAKIKQRHQTKAKQKQRAVQAATEAQQADRNSNSDNGEEILAADNVDVDAFFEDTISIPRQGSKGTKKPTGKRKRDSATEHDVAAETLDLVEDLTSSDGSEESEDDDHQAQLQSLAEKDPEFYKYLKEADPELLDFHDEGDLSGIGDSDEEEGEFVGDERPSKKQKRLSEKTLVVSDVSSSMIKKWGASMTEHFSIRALKEVVLAFRAAAHTNDADDKEYKYTIPNSDVYHEVMIAALRDVPAVLSHHVPVKESSSGKIRIATDSSKFKTLAPLIKSHTASLQHLLANLSDASTLRLTLQSFEPLLPYLLQFRKFLKVIIKSVASIWSDNASDEATRVSAFLTIRRLMVIGDAGIRETVLRTTYEGIVRGSRNTTVHTLPGINLMKNSAVEMWGVDQKVSYTTAFTFIRQLAIHLRTNITKPTKDSYKTIYNWQFVHSLDFWSRVLATHCHSLVEAQNGKESELRSLIYPVVQITLGVMRMIPTPTYFPLRFHLMRALLRISQSTGTFIPLSAALLEVLGSAEMRKPAKPSTLKPLDFTCSIRAPSSYLKSRVYQDGAGEQVTELLGEFFALWTKSVAYPELQLPVTVMLKRWLKTASKASTGNRNGKLNQALLLLVQKSESNARWIEERRNKINFAPKDRAEVEVFLKDVSWESTPLGGFIAGQRELRQQRAHVLEAGRREEERRRKAKKDLEDDDIDVT